MMRPEPIREIASLHGAEDDWPALQLKQDSSVNLRNAGECFHLQADVQIPAGTTVVLHLCGNDLLLTSDGIDCGNHVTTQGPLTHIEVLVDRTSIEVFGNHGEVSLTRCVLPARDGISLDCRGGQATFGPIKIWDMKSAWPDRVPPAP